ncbi:MAG: PIN domain-containing protein [Candidatus Thiosymbion ectosymbiont of Robbea hypermnestra]|nr:PIN domain-containing protein [Candidatus Thiosymbion ectosymbiont of Robbea hypermnestra]
MRVMYDLNVLLDVVQKRQPHYRASAEAVSKAVEGAVAAVFPSHGVTTLHYLVGRYATKGRADEIVDWLLARFSIGSTGRAELSRARRMPVRDFEDAVVVAVAESTGCDSLLTRNVADFASAPLRVMTPEEFLLELSGE